MSSATQEQGPGRSSQDALGEPPAKRPRLDRVDGHGNADHGTDVPGSPHAGSTAAAGNGDPDTSPDYVPDGVEDVDDLTTFQAVGPIARYSS